MKISLLALFLSASASANWFTGVGEFSYPHEIAMVGYADEAGCREDGGKWEDEFCFFSVEDSVKVEFTDAQAMEYYVTVDILSTNAHTCSFEGLAKWVGPLTLVASSETDDWQEGENGEEGKFVPVTCEVTVKYLDGNRVNVSNNGKCSNFCGARAMLEIEEAKRK